MQQDPFKILSQSQRLRVSDGAITSIFDGCPSASRRLILVLSQLGDFDSLEYIWWIQREIERIQSAENQNEPDRDRVLQCYLLTTLSY